MTKTANLKTQSKSISPDMVFDQERYLTDLSKRSDTQ